MKEEYISAERDDSDAAAIFRELGEAAPEYREAMNRLGRMRDKLKPGEQTFVGDDMKSIDSEVAANIAKVVEMHFRADQATRIRLSIERGGGVELVIYDESGKKIAADRSEDLYKATIAPKSSISIVRVTDEGKTARKFRIESNATGVRTAPDK